MPATVVTTLTVVFEPRVVTARDVTEMAFGESATITVAVVVIPGLRPATLPVNWNVTVYVVAPLAVVGSKATAETLAGPCALGSAVKAMEAL